MPKRDAKGRFKRSKRSKRSKRASKRRYRGEITARGASKLAIRHRKKAAIGVGLGIGAGLAYRNRNAIKNRTKGLREKLTKNKKAVALGALAALGTAGAIGGAYAYGKRRQKQEHDREGNERREEAKRDLQQIMHARSPKDLGMAAMRMAKFMS